MSTATGLAAARNLQLPLTSGTPRATSLIDLAVDAAEHAPTSRRPRRLQRGQPLWLRPARPEQLQLFAAETVYDSEGNAQSGDALFRPHRLDRRGRSRPTPGTSTCSSATRRPRPTHRLADAAPLDAELRRHRRADLADRRRVAFASVFPSGASAPLGDHARLRHRHPAGRRRRSPSPRSTRTASPSAKLNDVSISEDGLVTATFSDGTTQALGKLLVANFANPAGLRQRGDGRWTVTGDSGDAIVGEAGGDGFGRIQSGALERANVDITEELVALIAAQRNFQANAKAIETANSMTQSIINLRELRGRS